MRETSVPPEQPRSGPEERAISIVLILSFVVSIGALVFFAWLADQVFEGDARAFDDAVRNAVHAQASPALSLIMRVWTHFGDPPVIVGLTVIAFIAFWSRRWRRGSAWIAVTMAGAVVLDVTLKLAFHRPRPEAFFGVTPTTFSFPSGHALGSFCFYATVAALISHRVRSRTLRISLGILAAAMIGGIGFSRIYLGVHYPTDVIAGYTAAAIWVSTLIFLDRFRVRWRRAAKFERVP